MNPIQLDKAYNEFVSSLSSWIPEGIIEVDMSLLEETGLLTHVSFEEDNNQERKRSFEDNLLFMSKTMPNRGHDKDRGTHGWLMGEPNPGRSL